MKLRIHASAVQYWIYLLPIHLRTMCNSCTYQISIGLLVPVQPNQLVQCRRQTLRLRPNLDSRKWLDLFQLPYSPLESTQQRQILNKMPSKNGTSVLQCLWSSAWWRKGILEGILILRFHSLPRAHADANLMMNQCWCPSDCFRIQHLLFYLTLLPSTLIDCPEYRSSNQAFGRFPLDRRPSVKQNSC